LDSTSSPGDSLRNWASQDAELVLYPYVDDCTPKPIQNATPHLTDFSSHLKGRVYFGQTNEERGLKWWEFAIVMWRKRATPRTIAYCEISTHCHCGLGDTSVIFPQTTQTVKLPTTSSESEHLALLCLLNSSAALFWLKQVCFSKRESEQPEKDTYYVFAGGKVEQLPVPVKVAQALKGEWNPLAKRLSELAQACWERGQKLPSLAMKKLFEKSGEAYHEWNSSLPGYEQPHPVINISGDTIKDY
jgi:hypothetical protein